MVNIAVLACVLRATTKKGRQLFRRKRCTPEKIPATLMSKRKAPVVTHNSVSSLYSDAWVLQLYSCSHKNNRAELVNRHTVFGHY